MLPNPLDRPIKYFAQKFLEPEVTLANVIPYIFWALVLGTVLVVFVVLWPYGILIAVAATLWEFILDILDEMKKELGLMETMPYMAAVGLIFIFWIPFAIACIPAVLFGLVGAVLAGARG